MDLFTITPTGSMYTRDQKATAGYLDLILQLPKKIKDIIGSEDTGSYIKGLARTYDIAETLLPNIAFAILEIAIGKKSFAQLAAILSTELKLPNDKAQKMAAEIEKDVFGPVKAELETFLREQKQKRSSITSKLSTVALNSQPRPAGQTPSGSPLVRGRGLTQPQNVLNLKELNAGKKPTQLPARPVQKDLPVRPKTTYLTRTSPSKGEEKKGEVRKPPAPLPPPLTPPRAGGEPQRFPLPPKPPESPIDFT